MVVRRQYPNFSPSAPDEPRRGQENIFASTKAIPDLPEPNFPVANDDDIGFRSEFYNRSRPKTPVKGRFRNVLGPLFIVLILALAFFAVPLQDTALNLGISPTFIGVVAVAISFAIIVVMTFLRYSRSSKLIDQLSKTIAEEERLTYQIQSIMADLQIHFSAVDKELISTRNLLETRMNAIETNLANMAAANMRLFEDNLHDIAKLIKKANIDSKIAEEVLTHQVDIAAKITNVEKQTSAMYKEITRKVYDPDSPEAVMTELEQKLASELTAHTQQSNEIFEQTEKIAVFASRSSSATTYDNSFALAYDDQVAKLDYGHDPRDSASDAKKKSLLNKMLGEFF